MALPSIQLNLISEGGIVKIQTITYGDQVLFRSSPSQSIGLGDDEYHFDINVFVQQGEEEPVNTHNVELHQATPDLTLKPGNNLPED